MEMKINHLGMIQGVINRMAHNSFLLKGWNVVLVSGLLALAAKESKSNLIYLTYLPVIAFWVLDGYVLWQERLYRKLYDKVRLMEEQDIDFTMNTASVKDEVCCWFCVILSKTLVIFHGALLVTVGLINLYVLYSMRLNNGS